MQKFLQESEYVNFSHPEVKTLAQKLSNGLHNDVEIARACFLYVRDEIHHSGDYKDQVTTLKASEVLEHKTGWCYAKSILLAALLRANSIPTGFCYQRLSCSEYNDGIYCLHGLNAVYLREFGWYKIDARENKEGVNARFDPPNEHLAFVPKEYEYDLPEIHDEPIQEIIDALTNNKNYDEMVANFPDIKE